MKIDISKYSYFEKCIEKLSKISLDSESGETMTFSDVDAVNFDKATQLYIKKHNLPGKTCSCDAVLSLGDGVYFIEFKNGKLIKTNGDPDKGKTFDIHLKILESLHVFNDIYSKNLKYSRENINFVLVFNKDKNIEMLNKSSQKIHTHLANKSDKDFIYFNLEKYKKNYFNNIYTITDEYFNNVFLNKINSKPAV